MKIAKITLSKCNTPFKIDFHSPQRMWSHSESIIVILQFNNGISGYGESAPRSYVTGETSLSVTDTIKDRFAKILFHQEINTFDDVEKILGALEQECINKNVTTYNSALGAIDIALLDALRQFQGIPLQSFLGPIETKRMSISLAIPFLHGTIIKELHQKLNGLNPDSIKILLGNSENDNIQRVKLIRSLFGSKKEIRIEANGKWSFTQAISNIEKLKRFNISGVEQPLAKNNVEGMQKIRHITGISVIADESMCSLTDAQHLIESGACDIVNIKISKCGGLVKSKQIRDYAQSRNVPCQIGAHVGETAILSRVGHYFAMTTSNLFCFEGLSHLLFENYWKDQLKKQVVEEDTLANSNLGTELTNISLKPMFSLTRKNTI